jgi:osmotically inducible lipoprotein OsmB
MFIKRTLAVGVTALALAGCDTSQMSQQDRAVAGGLGGAAAGFLTARALDADRDWQIIGALAGAAVGTLVAQNRQTGDCAYARGDGTYYVAPCP